jgi:hypothetical protein
MPLLRVIRTAMLSALLLGLCVPAWSFTQVFIALRRADAESKTPEQFDEKKQAIFDRNGVTADQMREFVRDYSRNPQRMAALWDTIEARIRKPPSDTATRDTTRLEPPRPAADSAPGPGAFHQRGGAGPRGLIHRPDTLPPPDTLHGPGSAQAPGALR